MQQRFGILAVAAVLASGTLMAQKAQLSDAQVEANVLKALAADASLTTQPIQSSTAFGVVTLTGAVQNDAVRDRAEQIASRTEGVKKVVDQLSVGEAAVASASAPATAVAGDSNDDPAARNVLPGDEAAQQPAMASTNGQSAGAVQQYPLPGQGDGSVGAPAQGYPPTGAPQAGAYSQTGQYSQNGQYPQGQYPQNGAYPQDGQYPQAGAYPQSGYGHPAPRMYRRDWERQQAMQNGAYPAQGGQYAQGQPGGQQVVVPAGVTLPVRITRWVSSGDAEAGSRFTAVVNNDVLAGGLIAIPRGAEVEGTVVEAKGAGVLKGRGELVLQLNALDLGGRQTPLIADTFRVNGHDKTARSVNSTIIGGAIGALFGAAVGGGTGAAVGAGVGGAAGLGTAAASHSGNVDIPAEALLQFRLTAPLPVVTVSEAEMQRLGNFAGPQGARRPMAGNGYGPGPYGPGPYGPGPYGRPYGYYGY